MLIQFLSSARVNKVVVVRRKRAFMSSLPLRNRHNVNAMGEKLTGRMKTEKNWKGNEKPQSDMDFVTCFGDRTRSGTHIWCIRLPFLTILVSFYLI